MVCDTRSDVMVGASASTRTESDIHFDQFPAASVAWTAIVHVPDVSVNVLVRAVVVPPGCQASEPFRYFIA